MTSVVGSVVHRVDVGEPGEVDQARAEDRSADGGGQALALGGGAAGGLGCGADRHGISLLTVGKWAGA